ncbi:PPP1R7, partial [Cervus elaphus hippelaphus]
MVADLSAHSLKDGEERGAEDPEGTGRGESLKRTAGGCGLCRLCSAWGAGRGVSRHLPSPLRKPRRAWWARARSRVPSEELAEGNILEAVWVEKHMGGMGDSSPWG